ncbi:MAG: pyridoxal phosphate-dependent aminotransferase [Oligoflexia bacterium]|nr:pyridoxal phosphate-dependent aminotransferase [Oligoflexia bacterium]
MTHPLSKKILGVKASPTITLNAKATAMIKQGLPVLSFAVGEPHFPTPQIVVDKAIESMRAGRTKYGAAGGGPELRKAIATKLERENRLKFAPEQIVVGIGAKEILFHLMLTLLNDGDEVLLPAPFWVSYADQVIAAGGVPVIVPVPDSFPANPFDIAEIEKYATPRTVAIVINSPNNPSGYVLNEGKLREIGAWLSKKDWWVISDEIYEYLSFDIEQKSLLEICPDLRDRFILINGFSKSFCMTGWRVGYGAGPQPVMNLVRSLQSHSSTCLPMFIEDASIVAINGGRELMRAEIAEMNSLRKTAIAEFEKIKGLPIVEPQGAFYVFLDLRPFMANTGRFKDTMAICEWLLNDAHVALVPGEAFGAPGFARFSYAVAEEKLREGIARIARALA